MCLASRTHRQAVHRGEVGLCTKEHLLQDLRGKWGQGHSTSKATRGAPHGWAGYQQWCSHLAMVKEIQHDPCSFPHTDSGSAVSWWVSKQSGCVPRAEGTEVLQGRAEGKGGRKLLNWPKTQCSAVSLFPAARAETCGPVIYYTSASTRIC